MKDKKPTYEELLKRIAKLESTERNDNETTIQNSYFSAIIEATDNICVIKDLNLKVVAANHAFVKAAGKKNVSDLIGKTDAEIYNIPEDIEPVKGYMQDDREAQELKKGDRILREEKIVYPDKTIGTILTTKFPVYDTTDKVIATANISVDITERVRIKEGLISSREDFRVLNQKLTEMLQISKLELIYQFITDSLQEQFPGTVVLFFSISENENTVKPEAMSGLDNTLLNKIYKLIGYNIMEKKYQLIPKYKAYYQTGKFIEIGSMLDLASTLFSSKIAHLIESMMGINKMYTIGLSEEGRLLATVLLVTFKNRIISNSNFVEIFVKGAGTIIKNKQTEIELKKREAALIELNTTKDKLFSIIAHDLKNPLNTIVGFSNLIKKNYDKYSDDKIKKFNELIYKSSQNVSDLLENLLTWSRAQQNQIMVKPEIFNVYVTVENCFDLLRLSADKKSIELNNKVKMNFSAYADVDMISTVLRNLISNAIKYTTREGKIEVQATRNKQWLTVAVADTGVGMEKGALENLFALHRSSSEPGTDGEPGSGLGLVISQEFIQKNNGQIWAESTPGRGSTFYFSIPFSK